MKLFSVPIQTYVTLPYITLLGNGYLVLRVWYYLLTTRYEVPIAEHLVLYTSYAQPVSSVIISKMKSCPIETLWVKDHVNLCLCMHCTTAAHRISGAPPLHMVVCTATLDSLKVVEHRPKSSWQVLIPGGQTTVSDEGLVCHIHCYPHSSLQSRIAVMLPCRLGGIYSSRKEESVMLPGATMSS